MILSQHSPAACNFLSQSHVSTNSQYYYINNYRLLKVPWRRNLAVYVYLHHSANTVSKSQRFCKRVVCGFIFASPLHVDGWIVKYMQKYIVLMKVTETNLQVKFWANSVPKSGYNTCGWVISPIESSMSVSFGNNISLFKTRKWKPIGR
jgi:hypothetical protein